MEEISINITVREEQMEDKKVFIINNEELGVADFGNTLDQAQYLRIQLFRAV